jgi:hypothetical protein
MKAKASEKFLKVKVFFSELSSSAHPIASIN